MYLSKSLLSCFMQFHVLLSTMKKTEENVMSKIHFIAFKNHTKFFLAYLIIISPPSP